MKSILLSCCIFFLFTQVKAQNALSFDGSNDKVDIGNGSALQITGNTITIEAWIYPTLWRTNVWEGCIVVKEQNSSNNGYMFRAGNLGRLNFGFSANGLPWRELTTAQNILSLNNWQHVAAAYDGSKIRLFVDGVQVDSASYTGNIGNASNNCFIGGYYGTGRNFPGKIDEVRIWNVARTGTQIAASMNGEFCGVPTGLVAYYQFNQGVANGNNTSQTTLNDLAGNNNGTLQNFALTGSTSNWTSGATLTSGTGGTGTASITACDSLVSPSGNYVWTTNGTYIDTVTSSFGCDSILTISLSLINSTIGTMQDSSCFSYTSPSGNYTWNTTGVYYDTLTNAAGCDSILELDLEITTINTSVLQSGQTLTSWESNAQYQWLDCNNGYVPMWGYTSKSFTPPFDGSYAVEVIKNGCVDTSGCYTVTGIGIEEDLSREIKVYPNPVKNVIQVAFPGQTDGRIQIFDFSGKLIYRQEFVSENQLELTLGLNAGVYMLELETEGNWYRQKITVL